jgi:hypothetical protein
MVTESTMPLMVRRPLPFRVTIDFPLTLMEVFPVVALRLTRILCRSSEPTVKLCSTISATSLTAELPMGVAATLLLSLIRRRGFPRSPGDHATAVSAESLAFGIVESAIGAFHKAQPCFGRLFEAHSAAAAEPLALRILETTLWALHRHSPDITVPLPISFSSYFPSDADSSFP